MADTILDPESKMDVLSAPDRNLADALIGIMGRAHVLQDAAERAYYAADLFFQGPPALLVVQPASRAELVQAVKACYAAGAAIVPRGGGLSYTGGYVPTGPRAVIFDTRRLNRVVAVEADDLYVTVEAGCTWSTLAETLARFGLRVPHSGPASGRVSTIGGALSQNSLLFGSSAAGTAADSVLGLEVVSGPGNVVVTGSGAVAHGTPFYRPYGPDLTGLFLGDCGALGIKTQATLRLEAVPAGIDYASFRFPTFEAMVTAACAVGRRRLATECLGSGPWSPSGEQTNAALPALHVVVEGRSRREARDRLIEVKGLCGHQGSEIEPVVPKYLRAHPFTFIQSLQDPTGRRMVWTHGLVPYSRALHLYGAVAAFFNAQASTLARNGITVTISASPVRGAFLIEPVFYWHDTLRPIHQRGLDAEAKPVAAGAANPAATEAVAQIRQGLRDLFLEEGAVHLQIGKFYGYRDGLAPATFAALEGIKRGLDPRGLFNPGALGLS